MEVCVDRRDINHRPNEPRLKLFLIQQCLRKYRADQNQ